jgi:uncharacterized protein YjbI with pentapeptide repeats/F0F1-type ATP synthase membrane subunit b/b'
MDPTVVAAVIAAAVSVVTLVGTLWAQADSRRASARDAEKAVREQREQLDRTFTEQNQQLNRTLEQQRDQIDKTLKAQSDHLDRTLAEQNQQLDRTLAEQRTQTLNERFATASELLGSDQPAVRLAGVYAMAVLADDWEENRQTCVDVLCGYLRIPYEPYSGQATEPRRLSFRANREVRHTVIRVITAHLRRDAAVSWQGYNLDFMDVVFDGGDFSGAQFSGGTINFSHSMFSYRSVGSETGFDIIPVSFDGAEFSGGRVLFDGAKFDSGVGFSGARFSGGTVKVGAWFYDGKVDFSGARFSGGTVDFSGAEFSDSDVDFSGARFSGGTVDFSGAEFSDSDVSGARFTDSIVDFHETEFSGGMVNFRGARFSGGTVDFSAAWDWSVPPAFHWKGAPPPGVKLPSAGGKGK